MGLGDEIKRLREAKGWKPAELAKRSEVGPSILSRIESGTIRTPTEETVRKLAKTLGASLEHLLRLARDTGKGEADQLVLGFAHCIWSAPIILLAMRGGVEGVSLTSYGAPPAEDPSKLGEPHRYDALALRVEKCLRPGPAFGKAFPQSLSRHPSLRRFSIQDWSADARLRPYTADDLVALLTSASKQLDGIVAAYQVVESYEPMAVRCAHILYMYGGCSLLLVATNEKARDIPALAKPGPRGGRQAGARPLETRVPRFRDVWRALTSAGGRPLPALYSPGTVAEVHLKLLLAGRAPAEPSLERVEVDLGQWDEVMQTAEATLNDRDRGAFVFVGWEPQLSWLRARVQGSDVTCLGPEQLSALVPRRMLPYLSFDIVFRKDVLGGAPPGEVVTQFLKRVHAAVNEITASRDWESSAVMLIAKYLDMEPKSCAKVLSELNFNLMYYPEWVDFL